MRHAYLILAHTDYDLLQQLVELLDDARNDLYIHIDQKADYDGSEIHTRHSGLHVLPQRLNACWGDYSLVEVELLLFETAFQRGGYSYFHLLSGVDLPIQSQDNIHRYCEAHDGREFIGFSQNATPEELHWRSQHYFLYAKDFRSASIWKRGVRAAFVRLQDLVGVRRSRWEIKKGAQWCSVTSDFVGYLLAHRAEVRKAFRHTFCPDELVMQTLCWNSPFRDKACTEADEFDACKRFIPWENGELRPVTLNDVQAMKQSDKWFARKFSSKKREVIDALLRNA